MPRMTGMQLAARLTAMRPGLPVLMYSGYAEELDTADLGRAGVSALLRKPFDHAVLLEELERRLAPARSQLPGST